MTELFAHRALLGGAWADKVRIDIEGGRIVAVTAGVELPHDALGSVLPGMPNAHSHAFQRALAGHTEHRSHAAHDTFWTWRRLMYALAARVDARALAAIARQLYAEMLSAGYTSVVEFHYLHRAPGESDVSGAMLDALLTAAGDTGMRLIYAPVLYERGDFDDPSLTPEQQRFAMSLEQYLAHYEAAAERVNAPHRMALAAHSLRAVTPESLAAIADRAAVDDVPLHIHVAEQQREVDACKAALGARPVRWLLENAPLDARWTLVHATHVDAVECEMLARSGAVACLCPSTEGNLGDGLFPLADYRGHGGRIAIGSDSHVTVDPFEEMRWLEYGQRLISGQRNVAAVTMGHTGHDLFAASLAGGTQATGRDQAGLFPGADADLIALDDQHAALLGHDADSVLDALVFSSQGTPIDRVMTDGRWRVTGGAHDDAEAIRRSYAHTVRALELGTERHT